MNNKKYLISIVGPTAIGKTAKAIEIANFYNTEIISADSRQFFKEMNIGTAVPSQEELTSAPHHFIQHISVDQKYTVGDFENEAMATIKNLFKKHDILILVGGSGLYIKSILEGLDNFPEIDPHIREQLNYRFKKEGIISLQQELQEIDPEYFNSADIQNPHRVIRALEICIGTGKKFSAFLHKNKNKRPFKTIEIGLTAERDIIYDRINRRVDIMLQQGLLEEVKNVYSKRHYNALNTVGYKELFRFLDGEISLPEATEEIKKNTRRFAKRQLTWFRKNNHIKWYNYTESVKSIINYIEEIRKAD